MAETQTATGGKKIRLREYETLFVCRHDTTDESVEKLKERIRGVVGADGGKVLKFTNWGKKKTAFPIKKQPRAIFVHCNYLANPGLVSEVERNLSLSEDVEKFMTTLLANEVDPETRQVEPDVKLAGDADERPRGEGGREGFEGGFGGDREREREPRERDEAVEEGGPEAE